MATKPVPERIFADAFSYICTHVRVHLRTHARIHPPVQALIHTALATCESINSAKFIAPMQSAGAHEQTRLQADRRR